MTSTATNSVCEWINAELAIHNSDLEADFSPRRPNSAFVNLDADTYAAITDDDGTWTVAICGQSSAGAYNGPILHEARISHSDPMSRAYLTIAHITAARDLLEITATN